MMTDDQVVDIATRLGRMEGKLDSLTEIGGGIEKLADRVTSLEKWQGYLKGGWAMLMALWSYITFTGGKGVGH